MLTSAFGDISTNKSLYNAINNPKHNKPPKTARQTNPETLIKSQKPSIRLLALSICALLFAKIHRKVIFFILYNYLTDFF
jgi:hypothetical protein